MGQKETHALQQIASLFDALVCGGEKLRIELEPSVFAVLRLSTNANLLDCINGKSPGFSPLRIRPAWGGVCPIEGMDKGGISALKKYSRDKLLVIKVARIAKRR